MADKIGSGDPGSVAKPLSDVQAVASANSRFGHDLCNVLFKAAPNANMVFSPFCLSTALAMTKHGVRNQTALEFQRVCHFPGKDESLASGYNKLFTEIQEVNKFGIELTTANRVYVQHGTEIKPEFTTTLQKSYLAGEVRKLDFNQSNEAAKVINAWAEEVTKGKIKDVISPTSLNNLTKIVLVNGVYFKGKWQRPFESYRTSKSAFHAVMEDGKMNKVQVDMMRNFKKFPYAELEHAQVVALPYSAGLFMLIILPKEKNGLSKIQSIPINHEELFEQANKSDLYVNLELPRFHTESTYELVKPLNQLGLLTAFGPDCDFSGMTENYDGTYITNVVQKAFITVTEEGTEAGAVSGKLCGGGGPPSSVDLKVDHPFMFQILYKPQNLVLFSGCVNNPAA